MTNTRAGTGKSSIENLFVGNITVFMLPSRGRVCQMNKEGWEVSPGRSLGRYGDRPYDIKIVAAGSRSHRSLGTRHRTIIFGDGLEFIDLFKKS